MGVGKSPSFARAFKVIWQVPKVTGSFSQNLQSTGVIL